jgi:hypothetical protein
MIMDWKLLWKILLILTLGGYSLLAIVVVIGGISNIIDMFKDLSTPSANAQ